MFKKRRRKRKRNIALSEVVAYTLNPALRGQRQVDRCEFEVSLVYIDVSGQLERTCLKKRKGRKKEEISQSLTNLGLPQAGHFLLALHPQEAPV